MTFSLDDTHPTRILHYFPDAYHVISNIKLEDGPHGLTLLQSDHEKSMNTMMTTYNSTISRLPFEDRPERPLPIIGRTYDTLMRVASFQRHGRNIFMFPPELLGMLSKTDIADIRMADLHLPYRNFYLSFGNALSFGLPGDPNIIDGAYISRFGNDKIGIMVTSRRTDLKKMSRFSWITAPEATFNTTLTFDAAAPTMADAIAAAILKDDIKLTVDRDAIEQRRADYDAFGISYPAVDFEELEAGFNKQALPVVERLFALIANCLCYLTAAPDAVQPDWPIEAPKGLVEDYIKADTPKRKRVAANNLAQRQFFHVNRIIFNLPTAVPTGPAKGKEAQSSKAPHWRRGYWRSQPFGQGRTERRLIWIQPVLVRADLGTPTSTNVYNVHPPQE